MRKCIGIISWLPEDPETRRVRKNRVELLLQQCNYLFHLPIMIIAQDWDSSVVVPANAILYHYPKLGITGARKELRKKFLESDYEYLIMLDDDCSLTGNTMGSQVYLSEIDKHPDGYGKFNGTLLKLFAISKEMYAKVDYPDLEPENAEIFEDIYIVSLLDKKYPEKGFQFSRIQLGDTSLSINDEYSTWYQEGWNRHEIGDKTRALLKEI